MLSTMMKSTFCVNSQHSIWFSSVLLDQILALFACFMGRYLCHPYVRPSFVFGRSPVQVAAGSVRGAGPPDCTVSRARGASCRYN